MGLGFIIYDSHKPLFHFVPLSHRHGVNYYHKLSFPRLVAGEHVFISRRLQSVTHRMLKLILRLLRSFRWLDWSWSESAVLVSVVWKISVDWLKLYPGNLRTSSLYIYPVRHLSLSASTKLNMFRKKHEFYFVSYRTLFTWWSTKYLLLDIVKP